MVAKKKAVKKASKKTEAPAEAPAVSQPAPKFDGRSEIVVGQARHTDSYIPLRLGKKLLHFIQSRTDGLGRIKISEDDIMKAIEGISTQTVSEGPINILEKANEIIYGDREKAYGNPRFNLDTIAQFWSVYMQRKFPVAMEPTPHFYYTAEDVAHMMILLKTARLIHNPTHVDSLTDQAGYAALQNRIQGS